jgi:ribonuclease III
MFVGPPLAARRENDYSSPMSHPLENRLGYSFRQNNLLEQALTHGSIRNERNLVHDNQRMEYLGDAALGLVCADYLYHHFPDLPEGRLTILRSSVTNTASLAEIARGIDLGSSMSLGRGEEQSGGRDKSNNLADTMEAVIGAAYLDGGLAAVTAIFNHLFAARLDHLDESAGIANPKGRLQEWAQQAGLPCPVYNVISDEGPSHQKSFVVSVLINEQLTAEGQGTTKRAAEADAARNLIKRTEAGTA